MKLKLSREVSPKMYRNFMCDFSSLNSCLNRNGKISMRKYFDKSYDYCSNEIFDIEFELLAFAADQYDETGRFTQFRKVATFTCQISN